MKKIILKISAQERLLDEYPFFKLRAEDIEAALPEAYLHVPKSLFDAVFEFIYSHEDDYMLSDFEAAVSDGGDDFYEWYTEFADRYADISAMDKEYDLVVYCHDHLDKEGNYTEPLSKITGECRRLLLEMWKKHVKKHWHEPNLNYVIQWLAENNIWHEQ